MLEGEYFHASLQQQDFPPLYSLLRESSRNEAGSSPTRLSALMPCSGLRVFLKALQSSIIDILDLWLIATKLSSLLLLQLPVSCHKITVQTLTEHPIGPSPCSNVVELPGNEFVPFVLFCYFDVHKRGERWVSEITSFPFNKRISQSLYRWR